MQPPSVFSPGNLRHACVPADLPRSGRILLVSHQSIRDPDTDRTFTLKTCRSEKTETGTGWEHTAILLEPRNKVYEPIRIPAEEGEGLRVIGELIRVL